MIVDELGRIPMSSNLANSLARASGYAEAQLHREVTLEHLLLALTEDPDAAMILTASNIDMARVVTDVSGVLGRIEERNAPGHASRLAVSADLKRILEAAAAASRGRRREINGAILLAAVVGDARTPAAHILRSQGLTFEEAIRVLQRAMAQPQPPHVPQVDEQAPETLQPLQPHAVAPPPPPLPAAPPEAYHAGHEPVPSQPAAEAVPPPVPQGGGRAASTEDLLAGARARVSRARTAPPPPPPPVAPPPSFSPAPTYEVEAPPAEPSGFHPVPGHEAGSHADAPAPDANPAVGREPWQPVTHEMAYPGAFGHQPGTAEPHVEVAAPPPPPPVEDLVAHRGFEADPASYAEPYPPYPEAESAPLEVAPPPYPSEPHPPSLPEPSLPEPQWHPAPEPHSEPQLERHDLGVPHAPVAPYNDYGPPLQAHEHVADAQPAAAHAGEPSSWMPPPLPRAPRPMPPPLPSPQTGRPAGPLRPVTPGASYPSFREPQVRPNPIYPPWPGPVAGPHPAATAPPPEMGPPPMPAAPPLAEPFPAPPADRVPWTPPPPSASPVPMGPPVLPVPAPEPAPVRAPVLVTPLPTRMAPAAIDADADVENEPDAPPMREAEAALAERRAGRASGIEVGQLIENIPRAMRVAIATVVEVRIAKADVKALAEGMSGEGSAYRHEVLVTKAMSVRLKAPEGGFFIEPSSPETQWIDNRLGLMADDYASWRWTVTPRLKGRRRLQLVVAARTVGRDGLAAETALPEQVIDVRVATNYGLTARRWSGWIAAAVAGGVLQHFSDAIVAAGAKLASLLAAG